MERFVIRGGTPISGHISVNGAKNHALKVLPAALLFTEPVTIENVPMVEDVLRMLEIIRAIGGQVNVDGTTVTITAPSTFDGVLPVELVPKLRASLLLLGPLLGRFGQVTLPFPGGDNIGKRPMDFFVDFVRHMGATVEEREAAYAFSAPNGLTGAEYFFPLISVTGTETLILAAVNAQGTTVIENAACEPEVVALITWLKECGADITGKGTHTITVTGGAPLTAKPTRVIPDRIEAGTFLILGAAANGDVTVDGCVPEHLTSLLHTFEALGIETRTTETSVTVLPHGDLQPQSVVTHEYPGFPTDLQAQMTVLLTQTHGTSAMRETIYEGRLFFTEILNSMGANITLLDAYRVDIHGATTFHASEVSSPDIRAGIALMIAAILADGETTITDVYQIDRGYQDIEHRLRGIGVNIERMA